jgi:ElaB/YqjD/DUF883 family membrane-anchored ribosome-binding protein
MNPRRDLSDTLDELRAQLAASASISPAERERLETLLRDVRDHVDHERHEPQSLADRLQEATEHFEESHPNLTMAIGAVAEALSRLGI